MNVEAFYKKQKKLVVYNRLEQGADQSVLNLDWKWSDRLALVTNKKSEDALVRPPSERIFYSMIGSLLIFVLFLSK